MRMRADSGPCFRLFAAAMLALVAASSQAAACSCQPNPSAGEILASASAVFSGIVEENTPAAEGQSVTIFRVTESFKGVSTGTTVRVRHPSGSSASCGVTFAPGEIRTLAAYRTGPGAPLTASLCSTWMFLPHVPLSKQLIEQMREMRLRP